MISIRNPPCLSSRYSTQCQSIFRVTQNALAGWHQGYDVCWVTGFVWMSLVRELICLLYVRDAVDQSVRLANSLRHSKRVRWLIPALYRFMASSPTSMPSSSFVVACTSRVAAGTNRRTTYYLKFVMYVPLPFTYHSNSVPTEMSTRPMQGSQPKCQLQCFIDRHIRW